MINRRYRLTGRKKIEEFFVEQELNLGYIVIRPIYLSICEADQRYYKFSRPVEVMQKKLPMSLIHEAIGRVLYDPKGEFLSGDEVVLIPGIPREDDSIIMENYRESSLFRSSNCDGFLQEVIVQPRERVVKLPKHMFKSSMAYIELMSVGVHAIERFRAKAHSRRKNIGVWGDGNLGFILSLFLKEICSDAKVYIFGKNPDKLEQFSFVDKTYLISDDLSEVCLDHAFECVGGRGSQKAINQMIKCIRPEGYIALLGVSEEFVEINTRLVLEKGITLAGNSRSTIDDYKKVVEIIESNPRMMGYLDNIISSIQKVRKLDDINRAFEIDSTKIYGKTIIKWEI